MKFIVSEQTDYEIEADTTDAALEKFLDAENLRDFRHSVRVRELLTEDGHAAE
jgi:hypothetical protein